MRISHLVLSGAAIGTIIDTPEQAEHKPPTLINLAEHPVRRRAILGGLTREYWIVAVA